MRTLRALLFGGFVLGCANDPVVRPPARVPCPDGGCPPSMPLIGGPAGPGTPAMGDSGVVMDASADAGARTANATGALRLVQRLPPSSSWLSPLLPSRWTITALDDTTLQSPVDGTGAWSLLNVPTRTPAGALAPLVALLATPPTNDLSSVQLLRAGESSSTLYAISVADLLAVSASAGVVPDLGASHIVVFAVDSGATPTPQTSVTVSVSGEAPTVLYDDDRGLMTQSISGTGPAGVALVMNLPPVAGMRPTREVALTLNRGGRVLVVSVPIVSQAVTWVGVSAP